MTLDARQYRDPMLVLMEKQEREERRRRSRSCAGCMHMDAIMGVPFCVLGNTRPGAENMRKCSQYKGGKE